MNVAAGPKLAATVTNSGGIGVIGGVRQTPKVLKQSIDELKSHLEDKSAPFGVDLLLPQVGGNARKTNVRSSYLRHDPLILPSQYDYTNGHLDELLDVIIDSKAALFVSAVGVPPKTAVDRLHAAGIPVMKQVPLSSSLPNTNNPANVAWLDIQRCVSDIHFPV